MKTLQSVVNSYAKSFPKNNDEFAELCVVKCQIGKCQIIMMTDNAKGEEALDQLKSFG